ncbi:MAG: ATP synthase F1 subunit epsilon [Acidobacteria bacterium]|nr:ATP synthase F1 subunit epsilon [Acidobacteriota bacterium]
MLKLEVVTPERKVIETEVDSVVVPTASGEIGIFTDHVPLISALKPGILEANHGGTKDRLAVGGGFVEVSSNKVAVLTDNAVTPEEIDIEAERREKKEAEQALQAVASSPIDETEAERERVETADIKLRLAADR